MSEFLWHSESLNSPSSMDSSCQTHEHISILTWHDDWTLSEPTSAPRLEITSQSASHSTSFSLFLYLQRGKLIISGRNIKIWAKVEPEFWFQFCHTSTMTQDRSTPGASTSCSRLSRTQWDVPWWKGAVKIKTCNSHASVHGFYKHGAHSTGLGEKMWFLPSRCWQSIWGDDIRN